MPLRMDCPVKPDNGDLFYGHAVRPQILWFLPKTTLTNAAIPRLDRGIQTKSRSLELGGVRRVAIDFDGVERLLVFLVGQYHRLEVTFGLAFPHGDFAIEAGHVADVA